MLRKTTLSILVIAIVTGALFGLLSCSKGADTYLEIKTSSPTSYLIPAATSSCFDYYTSASTSVALSQSVSSKYFTVRGLKFNWNHAYNALTIAVIRLKFNDDNLNGEYKCDIGGDDLSALKYDTTTFVTWTASIPATGSYSNTTTVAMSCDIRCGGITTKELGFRTTGRIQVLGYMTEPDGNQVPVNVSTPFSIENLN